MSKFKKSYLLILLSILFLILPVPVYAFTAGADYTVTLEKMNSDGTLSEVGSTIVTADSNGKITFSFSGVPTNPTTHFLVITVKDSNGNTVRRSFVPAPPEGGTTELGVNNLSDKQTAMLLEAASLVGSDDPVVIAFGLIFTRTPNLTASDIQNIAALGKEAIINGFEKFLTSHGVTDAQLQVLKNAMAYNANGKDLGDFTALFKSAVDNPAQAEEDMAKAAGLIADIFIDAAAESGIDLALILAADDAAGDIAENGAGAQYFQNLSSQFQTAINQSMRTFHMRISYVRLAKEYAEAMAALNASGSQVDTFNTAMHNLFTALENLDKKYAKYFTDPGNNPMTSKVQQDMDTDYSQAFTTFMNAITSTNADINQMRQNVASALGIDVSQLPQNLGRYYNNQGNLVNWSIPMVVATNWVADIMNAGGTLQYIRLDDATYPIPPFITWIGICSNKNYWDKQSCESNNGTWTVQRTDFTDPQMFPYYYKPSFVALMGIQEDVNIAEMTRDYLYEQSNPQTGGHPTLSQERDAKLKLANTLDAITGNIGGTIDGSTAISEAQKKALVRMMLPLNF